MGKNAVTSLHARNWLVKTSFCTNTGWCFGTVQQLACTSGYSTMMTSIVSVVVPAGSSESAFSWPSLNAIGALNNTGSHVMS